MDITIKNLPDYLTEAKVMEWVSVLVERNVNSTLVVPEADIKKAKTDIDAFRVDNHLPEKYTAAEKELTPEPK